MGKALLEGSTDQTIGLREVGSLAQGHTARTVCGLGVTLPAWGLSLESLGEEPEGSWQPACLPPAPPHRVLALAGSPASSPSTEAGMGTSPGHGPHHSPPPTTSTSQAWRKGQTPAQEWKILGTHQVRCPMPPTSYRCQLAGPSFMCQGSWGQKPQGIHPTWLSLVLGCAHSELGASWVNEQMDGTGRGRA